ncbi:MULTISPECIES: hypothetical protein [unclassified Halomonas]|uniref:hypothetical protein n=1 Tax=unclassified Halomonas TaxID=2609666 RepID=UPI0009ED1D8E|nr:MULTISPECIES: hypothetical protein [unclassified Halomonas]MBT2788036.1 hypothetical protein [Halomonas sp. ISL-106]MBT2795785.1 hypothetical protein [Halomonas sp. ISL-104]
MSSLICAIVTDPGPGSAADMHVWMLLILDDDSLKHLLEPLEMTDRETILSLVHHIDADLIVYLAVCTAINKSAEGQGDELINPS